MPFFSIRYPRSVHPNNHRTLQHRTLRLTSHVKEYNHPPPFYRLCWAVLCERWRRHAHLNRSAHALRDRFGFSPAQSLRWLGIASAANYVGSSWRLCAGSTVTPIEVLRLAASPVAWLMLRFRFRRRLRCTSRLGCFSRVTPFASTQGTLATLYPTGNPYIERAHVMVHGQPRCSLRFLLAECSRNMLDGMSHTAAVRRSSERVRFSGMAVPTQGQEQRRRENRFR